MKKKINVLLVEDSEDDAILISRELKKNDFDIDQKRVETRQSMEKELQNKTWDVIIADYALPKFNGIDALKMLKESNLDIPFIIVSGKIGEDAAVEAMKTGADDYIMKNNLKKLSPAIKRELKEYETRREGKKAKKEVEKYHRKLEDINKKLKNEISERKEAERNAVEAKEYLQNVIDSTSKIIIAVNDNGRVTIWNEMAEKITGYKEKDVYNRTISKLHTFSDSQQIEDAMKDISKGKKSKFDSVIISKDNAKKIMRFQGSLLKGASNNKIGIIFIGEDITRDAEMHGKLLGGNSYLIPNKQVDSAVNLFVDLVGSDHQGLFISRLNPELLHSLLPSISNIEVNLLSEEKLSNYPNISDLEHLIRSIQDFTNDNAGAIILLDGTHYLLTKFSFNELISALYQLNEIIIKNKSMMFVRFDPNVVDNYQMAVIENELHALPSQKIKGITLEDSVYEILKFIYQQNQNNALVPFKKVMSKFKISYSTAAKRLEGLEDKGLIFTRRQGKLRAIYISEKGKTLLHKREIAE